MGKGKIHNTLMLSSTIGHVFVPPPIIPIPRYLFFYFQHKTQLTCNKQHQRKRKEVRIICHKRHIHRGNIRHGPSHGVVAQTVDVQGHAFGDASCSYHVLQDEVPADGEGDELADGDVAVYIR